MSKSKTTQTVSLPAWQEQQMQELYAAGKGLAGQPFVPYTGPMVAGFNPDQLRQFEATRGLFETGMQYDPLTGLQQLAQAPTPTVGQVPSLLQADIAAYQSPYQQQVIDQTMADIQRQADIARGLAQSRAIGAGAFGGSRSALLEAESQRPFIEQMARTAAQQREAGFGQALRMAESDIARQQQMEQFIPQFQLQAQAQQAGLLGDIQAQNLARLGLLGQVGGLQQALQQQGIQAARGEFERALAYGPQQFGLLQAGTGTPLTSTTTSSRDRGLSEIGNLLAGAGTAYGAFFGGSDKRMKKDIKFLRKEKGHNIYSWNWNDKAKSIGWDKYPTIGVMAQEVMKYMPEAVVKDENGYLLVNYGELANA
jgi:hypothetical protein